MAAWLNEHEDAIRVVPEKPYGMEGMIPEIGIRHKGTKVIEDNSDYGQFYSRRWSE